MKVKNFVPGPEWHVYIRLNTGRIRLRKLEGSEYVFHDMALPEYVKIRHLISSGVL